MTDQTPNPIQSEKNNSRRDTLIAGSAMILIGLLALAAQFIQSELLGILFLPALGLIFLAWGIITREVGLMIPGGILTGLGTGVYLVAGPLSAVAGEAQGGIILMGLAAGFVLITLLSIFFGKETHKWPLIPAGIMGTIAAVLFIGGPALRVLEIAGKGWPVILIAIGLYLILWRKGLKDANK